jgi:AraC-like DNA-binding protein
MTTIPLPELPPLNEMRRLCRLVTRAVPAVTLAGHRVTVHDIRPNDQQTGKRVLEHEHSFLEAHVILSGHATYTMGETQRLAEGGTLLHGPHTPHAWEHLEAPCLRLLFWFSIEPAVEVARPARWPEWPDILWDIALVLQDAGERRPGWQDRASARVTVILSRLLSLAGWPETAGAVELPQTQLVATVEQFLRDNFVRPLTLDDIADHVGVSQRSLCRQFQQVTGMPVMEYLFTLRMDRAAGLLTETRDTVNEIGLNIGIPDASYFCRRFRQHFHMTPLAYRRAAEAGGR